VRFVHGGQFPSEIVTSEILPRIELLFVATKKDSSVLPESILKAIKHSQNEVRKVVTIVPASEVFFFKELLRNLSLSIETEVISEDDEIDEISRNLIKRTMKSRYGWTLQQFLTVSYSLRSTAAGVLAVNSDTVILRDQAWLDQGGKQILMESYEFNPEYYELIERVCNKFHRLTRSHITHHMLFQPKLLKSTIEYFGANSLQEFIAKFMIFVNSDSTSPICAEFEPYANFLESNNPKLIQKVKFSNLGVARGELGDINKVISEFEEENKYNSISFHSWME